jgi:hypothetical protein
MNNQRLYAARKERLNAGLVTLAKWCARRALGDHDESTTISMLECKVINLVSAVDRAGWARK